MFRRVSDIIEVNHDDLTASKMFSFKICKSIVIGADRSNDVNITLLEDANLLERSISDAHIKQVAVVPPVGFYFLKDFTLRGRGFLFSDNRLLDKRDLIPEYVRRHIDNGEWTELYPDTPLPVRRVREPALLLTSEAYSIYGHWLVDTLPKAWLYRAMFGKKIKELMVLMPHDIPQYATDILTEIFGFEKNNFQFYNWTVEDIYLDKALVPSLLHDSHIFHPAANSYVDFILSKYLDEVPTTRKDSDGFSDDDLIYVSRHKFRETSHSAKRSISNESSVFSIVQENGFKIVCPDQLTWVDKVRLFAGAKVIVGEFGSGLHNSIFGRKNAVVLCFRPGSLVQATLSALREQTLVYLCPTEENHSGGNQEFKIDERRLVRALETCKGLASGLG